MPIWLTGYSNPTAAIQTFVFPDKLQLYNSFSQSVFKYTDSIQEYNIFLKKREDKRNELFFINIFASI